jgi:hypothetical protein
MKRLTLLLAALAAAAFTAAAHAAPLEVVGMAGLPGIDATFADGAVSFQKTGAERRLLALVVKPAAALATAKSIEARGTLSGVAPGAAHLAVVAFVADGGVFAKIGQPVGADGAARVPLDSLKPTAFSADGAAPLDWTKVQKLWVGLVLDGQASGRWQIAALSTSAEALVVTAPLILPLGTADSWSVGKDPAVQHKLAIVNEGPHGEPVVRFDFTFPESRHLYALPTLPMPAEVDGYRALRVRYKASLPKGPRTLISLIKANGAQYIVEPAATADWTTCETPLADLKLGAWSKDDEGKLTMTPGMTVIVGCHGTADPVGNGTIWIAEIALVP